MKTKQIAFILFGLAMTQIYGQSLSGKSLLDLLEESDIKFTNKLLSAKGWLYKETTEGDASHYKVVTWAYNMQRNGAEQYLTMNIPSEQMKGGLYIASTHVLYTFVDKAIYNALIKDFILLGLKEFRVHTKGRTIIETYWAEKKYGVRIHISTNEQNVTSYNVFILKDSLFVWEESKAINEEKGNR